MRKYEEAERILDDLINEFGKVVNFMFMRSGNGHNLQRFSFKAFMYRM